ncbi:ATP-grasp domain-containing protein [Desulfoluna butyratoxydans]|uniref:D-alanine--d-alanine ligase c-terminal n=1 Tax=Desulfoluna butyratoxydans TaxID=231438 RepID=A0A4U8YX22_9BACT|nr:ATP-grasp domain-containing protein [Desulfoluna butyratoxydans]VFQ46572.1 d-alanine--d-alanine ligase c-terminal [Desulfoluna butyratoxydans]
MKIAVIYNRESQKVINLFGVSNREKYGLAAIQRIVNALKRNGHQVVALEGDKDLIDNLEEFMPRALKGERPGMAFNLSYGIQGQARYTHVPGILEMVGVPYVGSGPLAHSLALDKVVAKMIFVQNGLPTPKFAVLKGPGFAMPDLDFPIIVKPKNEAVSFGIKIVNTEEELRDAAQAIFDEFGQDVLAESYIEGREINVGLLGNGAQVEAFRPAELVFPSQGPKIYTMEDKKQQSGRKIDVVCPAPIDDATEQKAIAIAKGAFEALGCYDCARVDMRMDAEGNLYILEINSLPSLGEHGSYVAAAEAMGMSFPVLTNRLVEVASARYFGTPHPPQLTKRIKDPAEGIFAYLTERRDQLEKRVESWTDVSSRSDDAVGIRVAADRLDETLTDIGLRQVREFTDHRDVWTWEGSRGTHGGTVLITHLDVPVNPGLGAERFRRDPEWLYGEGIGTSRAPLAQLEFSLRALKHVRKLARSRIGVICYTDEGRDCEESAEIISKACAGASRAILLNPGISGDCVIHSRRGQRRYRLVVEGKSLRLGEATRSPEVMRVLYKKLDAATALSNRRNRIGISAVDIKTEAFPRRLPHRVQVVLQVSYPTIGDAEETERKLKALFKGSGVKWNLLRLSDRPPMVSDQLNTALYNDVKMTADAWDIPLSTDSSLWPSAAGLVLPPTPVLCGMGPVARSLHTSQESVSRISLVQRSLLLAQFLLNITETS